MSTYCAPSPGLHSCSLLWSRAPMLCPGARWSARVAHLLCARQHARLCQKTADCHQVPTVCAGGGGSRGSSRSLYVPGSGSGVTDACSTSCKPTTRPAPHVLKAGLREPAPAEGFLIYLLPSPGGGGEPTPPAAPRRPGCSAGTSLNPPNPASGETGSETGSCLRGGGVRTGPALGPGCSGSRPLEAPTTGAGHAHHKAPGTPIAGHRARPP